jgi:mannose-6-phosphate isomerase-like protein (cupin superfamily)
MPAFTLLPFSSAPAVPFKFDGRTLFSSGKFELVHLALQPGEAMEMHAQPFPVVFFVVEGCGTLAVGEETVRVEENTTVHVDAGAMRAWANNGERQLRILVGKILSQ